MSSYFFFCMKVLACACRLKTYCRNRPCLRVGKLKSVMSMATLLNRIKTDKKHPSYRSFFICGGLTTFCRFRCPPQLSLSDFGCSTVLVKVNSKNQHLKFEYCRESLIEISGFFLMVKRTAFWETKRKCRLVVYFYCLPILKPYHTRTVLQVVLAERLI